MNVAWVVYPLPMDSGVARGYVLSAFGMAKALSARMGGRLEYVPAGRQGHARVHFHYCSPHQLRAVPGKTNVLMSMWEAPTLPRELAERCAFADVWLVPSESCADTWVRSGLPRPRVVPLGVWPGYLGMDPSRSTLLVPGVHRRVLWVGSKAQRKGWELLASVWREAFKAVPLTLRPELYVKTIDDEHKGVQQGFAGEVTTDTRDLKPTEMAALYQSADVYLCTSFAEGFGLCTLEAMAAGALAVSPVAGGQAAFVTSQTAVVVPSDGIVAVEYGGQRHRMPTPTAEGLARSLRAAVEGFGLPHMERIREQGTALARRMTWDDTARELEHVLCVEVPSARGRGPLPAPPVGVTGEAASPFLALA